MRRSGEDCQIIADRGMQPVVQGFTDQRVPDRHLREPGNRALEGPKILLIEVVPGIHVETGVHGTPRRLDAAMQFGREISVSKRMGVRAGVKLDTCNPERTRLFESVGTARVDEQRNATTQTTELRDQWRESGQIPYEIESVIGGDLAIGIGHQRRLRGSSLANQ